MKCIGSTYANTTNVVEASISLLFTTAQYLSILNTWKCAANLFSPLGRYRWYPGCIGHKNNTPHGGLRLLLQAVPAWWESVRQGSVTEPTLGPVLFFVKPGEGAVLDTSCQAARLCPTSWTAKCNGGWDVGSKRKVRGHPWDLSPKPVTDSPLLENGRRFEQRKAVLYSTQVPSSYLM